MMRVSIFVIAALGVASSGCTLLGVAPIVCNDDTGCPSDQFCNVGVCEDEAGRPVDRGDGGVPDAGASDAGLPFDAGTVVDDAGSPEDDAGSTDGGSTDVDAGSADDAGSVHDDAGSPDDAGSTDVDAGAPDDGGSPETDGGTGTVDAGPVDAGSVDAGPVDAGPVDAGPADAFVPPACDYTLSPLWLDNPANGGDASGTDDVIEVESFLGSVIDQNGDTTINVCLEDGVDITTTEVATGDRLDIDFDNILLMGLPGATASIRNLRTDDLGGSSVNGAAHSATYITGDDCSLHNLTLVVSAEQGRVVFVDSSGSVAMLSQLDITASG